MKAYKLKSTINNLLEKGRLFFEMESGEMLLIATPTEPQSFYSKYTFENLKSKDLVYEVDLLDETRIHPHLYKPVKKLLEEAKLK